MDLKTFSHIWTDASSSDGTPATELITKYLDVIQEKIQLEEDNNEVLRQSTIEAKREVELSKWTNNFRENFNKIREISRRIDHLDVLERYNRLTQTQKDNLSKIEELIAQVNLEGLGGQSESGT